MINPDPFLVYVMRFTVGCSILISFFFLMFLYQNPHVIVSFLYTIFIFLALFGFLYSMGFLAHSTYKGYEYFIQE